MEVSGADDEGVEAGEVLSCRPECRRVARRDHRDRARRPRLLDRCLERQIDRTLGQWIVAKAEVHYLGPVLHDPPDAGLDVDDRPAVVGQHTRHDQTSARCHARDASAVVLGRGGDAGHVGAVTGVVLTGAVTGARVASSVDAVGRRHHLAGQVLLLREHARVHDPDAHARARRPLPRGRRADLLQCPLGAEQRILRRPRRPGAARQQGRRESDGRGHSAAAPPHASTPAVPLPQGSHCVLCRNCAGVRCFERDDCREP